VSGKIVVIPLSCAPIEECSGLFLGTLAFPSDARKAQLFADAYRRLAIRMTAIEDPAFADEPYAVPPRLVAMRDSTAEEIIREGEEALFSRKQAFFVEQARFHEALSGKKVTQLTGLGDLMANTAENRHVMTNLWLGKPPGASTKNLYRDAIAPSRPVIHIAAALCAGILHAIEANLARDEGAAQSLLLCDKGILALLLNHAEALRLAAIRAAITSQEEAICLVAG
jgi:hypothetical protein